MQRNSPAAVAGLLAWAVFEGWLVFGGWSERPFVSLGLGLAGASAVVALSALLAKRQLFWPLRVCGRHSIVIYLAFFLPMAISRTLLLRWGALDVGTVSLIVTVIAVMGALAMWWAARAMRLDFLFARPARFHIAKQAELAARRVDEANPAGRSHPDQFRQILARGVAKDETPADSSSSSGPLSK